MLRRRAERLRPERPSRGWASSRLHPFLIRPVKPYCIALIAVYLIARPLPAGVTEGHVGAGGRVSDAASGERPTMPVVRPITRGPHYHWFGYYDKLQFDPSGRFVLGMRVDFENRNPTPEDTVRVGMVDLEDGDRWIELGESRAWGWQQGCHLQWRPGSDREVIWNDRVGGVFVAIVLDVKTGRRRLLPRPVDNLSPDGRWALGVDFARIHGFRAGYGYAGVADPNHDAAVPEASGVYRMDLDTGETHVVVSLAHAAAVGPQHPSVVAGARRYINHVQWSPDGRRFLFLERPATRLLTAAGDGSDLRVVMFEASHYAWRDSRSLCVWTGGGYRLYADAPLAEGELLWASVNGHQTYFADRDWLLTDTYPDAQRMQTIYLLHLPTARRVDLGHFHSPPDYRGDWRADLHPRLSPDERSVCFDSPHAGGRQMYLMDIRGFGPNSPGDAQENVSVRRSGAGRPRPRRHPGGRAPSIPAADVRDEAGSGEGGRSSRQSSPIGFR